MSNNDILVRFHEMSYEEQLHETRERSYFLNAELVPVAQRANRVASQVADSAQNAICSLQLFQRTALCPMPTA
jgi:hypothetical protein